jgi:hypothetical protein
MPIPLAIQRIAGLSGRLKQDGRALTHFKKWEAEPTNLEAGHWRLVVRDHIPHSLNWQGREADREVTVSVETVGGTHLGRGRFVSDEPLVLDVWEMDRVDEPPPR